MLIHGFDLLSFELCKLHLYIFILYEKCNAAQSNYCKWLVFCNVDVCVCANLVSDYIDQLFSHLYDCVTNSTKPSCDEVQPATMASTGKPYENLDELEKLMESKRRGLTRKPHYVQKKWKFEHCWTFKLVRYIGVYVSLAYTTSYVNS